MQNYPVRATHRKGLEPAHLGELLGMHFENSAVADGVASASFGAIVRIAVRPNGRELSVDVTMNPKVTEDVAAETVQRYNRFLEEATGYSSKERAKRLRKSASASED
jgi:hypothetical protein